MSPKKVELKEHEYQEVYIIFKKLTTTKNIPTFEQFKKNLDIFFELTYDAYVGYGGGTTEAMLNWIEFMGSEKLALEYFRAVDNWHAYT
jgi:hypothetical protein